MASDQNDVVFPEEELDDDDETQEDEEEDEEDEDDDVLGEREEDDKEPEPEPEPSTSSATVTVAVAGSVVSNTSTSQPEIIVTDSSEPKRQRTEQQMEEKKALEDSRRLFQRLWTDEDEIELLQGFLDYTARRGSSHYNDTALFYDQIKSRLQLGFNKNQLVEKLRRLKKKYRNVLNKIGSGKEFCFKSPHDQATFEISRKIWNNTPPIAPDDDEISPNTNPNLNSGYSTPSRKRSRSGSEKREFNDGLSNNNHYHNNINNNNDNNNCNDRHSLQGLIEETVRRCLSPVLKELKNSAMGSPFGFGGRGFALNPLPLSIMNLASGEMVMGEKWRKQQMLELEVYSKRLELVQGEIKVTLKELRSAGAGGGG